MIKISANKLAEFITAKTPERKRSIVRRLIREAGKDRGYAPFYMAFRSPAKRFLEGGATDLGILTGAIQALKTRKGSKWKDTDARISKEAFLALQKLAPRFQELGVEFVEPASKLNAKLQFPDLSVTVTPDMMVHGERNGVPLVGALRFYLAKESIYQLGEKGAQYVAVMQHMWTLNNATGSRSPDSSHCMVAECFQLRVTVAPDDVAGFIAAIEHGAEEFVHLWHQISHDEAA
jgi:hypothetical protein